MKYRKAYAMHIYTLYVHFLWVFFRQFLPDEAKRILSHARAVVRRFSIVHVASAELEIEEGLLNYI